MARNIKSLLRKKKLTGKELGTALIVNLMNDIKNQGKPYKPLFTQADFDNMMSRLNATEQDYSTYGVYENLYTSILDSYNRGLGLYQQFNYGYSRLISELKEILNTEDAQNAMIRYPLIVTAEQYDRLKAEARVKISAFTESFNSLVFRVLGDALNERADPAEIPTAIADALDATKREPAKNRYYIDLYNSIFGIGYYTLPDGRRSDKMTAEEWQAALKKQYIQNHINTNGREPASDEDAHMLYKAYNLMRLSIGYSLFFNGADAIREAYRSATGKELEVTDSKLLEAFAEYLESTKDGVCRSLADPTTRELARVFEYNSSAEWHADEAKPEGLTQRDVLCAYYIDEASDKPTLAEKRRPLKDLKKDYPALYKAIAGYIEELVPQARGLKPGSQLYNDITNWGELEKQGFMSYRQRIAAPTDNEILEQFFEQESAAGSYGKRARIHFNSIAIIQNPSASQVDEHGDYIEPDNPLSSFDNIDSVADDPSKIAEIESFRVNLIEPVLGYLYAFNALMGILGDVYGIPEIAETARFDISPFEDKITAFNNLLYAFYFYVYGSAEEKARKRDQLKTIFTSLDYEKLTPSKEMIDAVKADIEKIGYTDASRAKLKYLNSFIAQLTRRGNES